MANKHSRSSDQEKKSICELSILLVSNIVKLSTSLRVAGLGFCTNNLPAEPQEDNEKSSEGTRKGTVVLEQKPCKKEAIEENIDATASIYIRQIREKIDNKKNNAAGKSFLGLPYQPHHLGYTVK
ncbi:hypothetical protein L6164_020691 [Bauhinia variegata]|uniref:Uncharacterized protein n=1 Tax=Bauhinia variegata TaxID=167791 RepID=A0ACB9MXC7_BAUVA|nr:hypothetical protein L6164_020691 [Bauhinia variegata]